MKKFNYDTIEEATRCPDRLFRSYWSKEIYNNTDYITNGELYTESFNALRFTLSFRDTLFHVDTEYFYDIVSSEDANRRFLL